MPRTKAGRLSKGTRVLINCPASSWHREMGTVKLHGPSKAADAMPVRVNFADGHSAPFRVKEIVVLDELEAIAPMPAPEEGEAFIEEVTQSETDSAPGSVDVDEAGPDADGDVAADVLGHSESAVLGAGEDRLSTAEAVSWEERALESKKHLLGVIKERQAAHPRSLQQAIGPSEIGTPCDRRLAYRLNPTIGKGEEKDPSWRATVGTAVHAWLEKEVQAWCAEHGERYHTENRVTPGSINGVEISGSVDLYDRELRGVIDYKIQGPTSYKRNKEKIAQGKGPDIKYRTQAQAYGSGYAAKGEPVEWVAILILPAAGERKDALWWAEKYDPEVAVKAFERADFIAKAGTVVGWDIITPRMPTADDYCAFCPYFEMGARNLAVSCPGHPGAWTGKVDLIDQLIGPKEPAKYPVSREQRPPKEDNQANVATTEGEK